MEADKADFDSGELSVDDCSEWKDSLTIKDRDGAEPPQCEDR